MTGPRGWAGTHFQLEMPHTFIQGELYYVAAPASLCMHMWLGEPQEAHGEAGQLGRSPTGRLWEEASEADSLSPHSYGEFDHQIVSHKRTQQLEKQPSCD